MRRVDLYDKAFNGGAEAAVLLDEVDMTSFDVEIVRVFAEGIGAVVWMASIGNMIVVQFPGREPIEQQMIPVGSIENQIKLELARRIKQ